MQECIDIHAGSSSACYAPAHAREQIFFAAELCFRFVWDVTSWGVIWKQFTGWLMQAACRQKGLGFELPTFSPSGRMPLHLSATQRITRACPLLSFERPVLMVRNSVAITGSTAPGRYQKPS